MNKIGLLWILMIIGSIGAVAFEEGIYLYRPGTKYIQDSYSIPEYLSIEDLTFFTCIEEDTLVKSSVLCIDNNNFEDVTVTKWEEEDNCFIGSFNLEGFTCKHLRIQSEYIKNNENIKLVKELRINKFTSVLDKIVDTQYSDGGWEDSLNTASGIHALAHFKDIYNIELDKAMDWLKLNRNDELKCWPKGKCSVTKTANILALLTMSEYNDTRRIINDGRNWLQKKQNYYEENDDWTLWIKDVADGVTLALVGYERVLLDENFTIPGNSSKNYTFDVITDNELIVIADENVELNITNADGDLVYEYFGDNLSYDIPGPCWSPIFKGEVCDKETTAYSLVTDLPDDHKERGIEWMIDHLSKSEYFGLYFGDDEDDIVTNSVFLYSAYDKEYLRKSKNSKSSLSDEEEEQRDLVVNWLLYKQNNEGSWGSGSISEKVIPSSLSVMSLMKNGFNRTAESVEDAEEWTSDNEKTINSTDTHALASAFYILRNNARPLLISRPGVVEVTKNEFDMELHNPTTFNLLDLKYELSENLEEILDIETKQVISAYSYRKLKIRKTGSTDSDVYGYLSITNLEDEVTKIPIVVSDFPFINLTQGEADKSLTIFGKNADLKFDVSTISKHSFTCSIEWEGSDIATSPNIRVTKKGKQSIKITFAEAESTEDIYKGQLRCVARGETYTYPLSYHIKRYSAIPYTVSPKNIIVNSTRDKSFVIKNNLDEELFVDVKFKHPQSEFMVDEQINVLPNEERNITIINKIASGVNTTGSYFITLNALDHKQEITLTAIISYEPARKLSTWFIIIILTLFLFIFGGIGYILYRYKEKLLEMMEQYGWLKSFKSKKKIQKRVKKVKSLQTEDKNLAITNLVQILRFRKTSDEEITKRLIDEGFKPKEVKDALLPSGIILDGIEEILVEKQQKGKKNKTTKK